MLVDRRALATALAKAVAFKECGKRDKAAEWAKELVRLLECEEILK